MEEAKRKKLYELNNITLKCLLTAKGKKYGIKPKQIADYSYEHSDGKNEAEVWVSASKRFFCICIKSAILITDEGLMDLVLRCVTEDGSASGADYFALGRLMMEGKLLKEDRWNANTVFELAVVQNYAPAYIYYLNTITSPSVESRDWYAGNWDKIYEAYCKVRAKGMPERELQQLSAGMQEVIAVEKKAKEQHDREALWQVARSYYSYSYHGIYMQYVYELAEMGDLKAIQIASELAFNRKDNLQKKVKGIRWHLMLAELGFAEGMYRAARIFELTQQTGRAVELYQKSADKGLIRAMGRLAVLYREAGNIELADYYEGKVEELS